MKKLICTMTLALATLAGQAHAGLMDNIGDLAKGNNSSSSSSSMGDKLGKLGELKELGSDVSNVSSLSDGKKLATKLVDKQCRSQLNGRLEWQLLMVPMSSEKKAEWEDKVCGCASEEAVNAATSKDLIRVANPSTRDEAVASMTKEAVTTCVKRFK